MKLTDAAAALAHEAVKPVVEGKNFEVAEAVKPQLPSTGPGAHSGRTAEDTLRGLLG